jgi:urease accessory protein
VISAQFELMGSKTELFRLYEAGGYRLCLPKAKRFEAIILNTGGGMAGGDRVHMRFAAGIGSDVLLTTQSQEKIYRSTEEKSQITVDLDLEQGARFEWLPQETILFHEAKFERKLNVQMSEDAALLLHETQIFGRLAKGELITTGNFHESWRIRRGNRLVFAEDLAVDGAIGEKLDHKALGNGARALGILLYIAPDAEFLADDWRGKMAARAEDAVEFAASAWNGLLCARFASASPERLRGAILAGLFALRDRAVPRVWQV